MIPAVLSCIFVIYLYHTLNAGQLTQGEPAKGASNELDSSNSLRALTERAAKLNDRLNHLKAGSGRGDIQ